MKIPAIDMYINHFRTARVQGERERERERESGWEIKQIKNNTLKAQTSRLKKSSKTNLYVLFLLTSIQCTSEINKIRKDCLEVRGGCSTGFLHSANWLRNVFLTWFSSDERGGSLILRQGPLRGPHRQVRRGSLRISAPCGTCPCAGKASSHPEADISGI